MIYIVGHKKFGLSDYIKDDDGIYKKIYVGQNDYPILKPNDSSGDSISYKNKDYCELTAHYWIWKNTSDNIKGIMHYRRLFADNSKSIFKFHPMNFKKINKILTKKDIILPYQGKIKNEISTHYKKREKEWKIIEEYFNRYDKSYIEVLHSFFNQEFSYYYNMLICNARLFDEYSKWLFNILNYLEEKIGLNEQRQYGYISERLLNLYVVKNKLKIKECMVYFVDKRSKTKTAKYLLKEKIKHIYIKFIFFLKKQAIK